jgi:type I restriction enzyme S subunit
LRFKEFDGDWEEDTLGNLCSNFKAGSGITSESIFDEGEYPVYGGNGLRGYTDKFNYEGNFVLIGRQGALCGNINYIRGKSYVSEHAIVIGGTDISDIKWLNYKLFLMKLGRLSESSAQPGLSVEKLKKLKTVIPKSLKEQQKIAAFLSLIDERISTQIKIIERLETLIKGMRGKLLSGELRFKDIKGKNFAKWEKKRLGEVAVKKSSNIAANKIEENIGDYIIYGASGILKRVDFYEEDNDYISIVKDGAGVGRIFYCAGKSSVLGTMEIIKPQDELNSYFLFCVLSNIDFAKYISGSTIPHIYFKDYSNETCFIPCLEEQTKIANFLWAINEKIARERKLHQQYEWQKKYLLQNMFI